MRQSGALLTIATHPRMTAAVAATVVGCLALLTAFAMASLVGSSPASAAGTTYTIKDLGALDGPGSSFAVDVNDSGQVAGWSYTSTFLR